jgi:hypothetical protein
MTQIQGDVVKQLHRQLATAMNTIDTLLDHLNLSVNNEVRMIRGEDAMDKDEFDEECRGLAMHEAHQLYLNYLDSEVALVATATFPAST